MAEPVRWQGKWWHQQPDGSWLRFNEQTQSWEPHAYQPVASGKMSGGAKAAIITVIAIGVLFVVAILAAIAIPVFLKQREEGWTSQVQSALENAAVAEESYFTSNSRYTPSVQDLEAQGLATPQSVQLVIPRADVQGYCIEARHFDLQNEIWSYDSTIGSARPGPCS